MKKKTLTNIKLFTVGVGDRGKKDIEGSRGKGIKRQTSERMGSRELQNAIFVIYLFVEYFQKQEPKMLCLLWCLLRLVSQKANEIHTWAENVLAFGEIASPFLCLQNCYIILSHKI